MLVIKIIYKKNDKKITTGPSTRAWTSVFATLDSIKTSFDDLKEELPDFTKNIDFTLLTKLHSFFESIKFAFLKFELKNEPTLHYAVLCYHKLVNKCSSDNGDCEAMQELKSQFKQALFVKYFTSLKIQHYTAVFLHPNYKVLPPEPDIRS